jgi:cyclase
MVTSSVGPGGGHSAAQADEAHVQEVRPGVFAYIQPDGSWWVNNAGFVASDEQAIVVDTCATERRTRRLITALARATGGARPRTVVNTHHHGDHSFGNCLLENVTVVAHEKSRLEMIEFGEPPQLTSWEQIEWGAVRVRAADVTFADRLTLWAGTRRCEAIYTGERAHTDGDCVIWVPDAHVLFSGDLLFNGGTPFVLGGSVHGLRRVLSGMVLGLAPAVIVPGHGPVCDTQAVHDTLAYLDLIASAATTGIDAGLTPLEMAREVDLGSFSTWSDPERVVGNLYRAYYEAGAIPAVDEKQAWADMVTWNGGKRLRTLA